MKGLTSKASQFFEHGPSQDENVAIAHGAADGEFGAGIETHTSPKNVHRVSQRRSGNVEKPLPMTPSSVSTITLGNEEGATGGAVQTPRSSEDELDPATLESLHLDVHDHALGREQSGAVRSPADAPAAKSRSGLFGLRSKKSSFFRQSDVSEPSPPPPPPRPQISVDPFSPDPSPHTITSHRRSHRRLSSLAKLRSRVASISRPISLAQSPTPELPSTPNSEESHGPHPPRPPRPDSLDDETLKLLRDSNLRTMLIKPNTENTSALPPSTPDNRASIAARLGLPSGHTAAPNQPLNSSTTPNFPIEALQPTHWRDTSGSIRIPEHTVGTQSIEEGQMVEPLEQYDESLEGYWGSEKRVSHGPNGNPGMLFRDGNGGFHFVADI